MSVVAFQPRKLNYASLILCMELHQTKSFAFRYRYLDLLDRLMVRCQLRRRGCAQFWYH